MKFVDIDFGKNSDQQPFKLRIALSAITHWDFCEHDEAWLCTIYYANNNTCRFILKDIMHMVAFDPWIDDDLIEETKIFCFDEVFTY